MKKLLLAAALFAYTSPTLAESFVTTSSCRFSGYYGYVNCYATRTYVPDPFVDLEQERRDAAERHKEELKWEAFCKPKFKTDAYGIRRASYTRSGCEFGRNE